MTEPVPATFDWHHSIRVAGTPPPTYKEARQLPAFEDGLVLANKERRRTEGEDRDSESSSVSDNEAHEETDNRGRADSVTEVAQRRDIVASIVTENERNSQMINADGLVPNGTHGTLVQSHDSSNEVRTADDIHIDMEEPNADVTSV